MNKRDKESAVTAKGVKTDGFFRLNEKCFRFLVFFCEVIVVRFEPV